MEDTKELRRILDSLSELSYVVDMHTYELLYVSPNTQKDFKLEEWQTLEDRRCYKLLQRRETPCPFCTMGKLNYDSFYDWDRTNPVSGKSYLLKDKLVNWSGRKAMLEIAFDITERERQKQELQTALELENMVLECVRTLHSPQSYEENMNHMLERVGMFLDADRSYIFEVHGESMSNTFEWCREGVQPQIDSLKALPVDMIGRWKSLFLQKLPVFIRDLEKEKERISDTEYETLKRQDIQSLVAVPLYTKKWIGYIGVDNPPADKMRNVSSALSMLGYFAAYSIQEYRDTLMLDRLSYYDSLTGTKNRNAYILDLEQKFSDIREPVGFVFADVNNLKETNDKFGHGQGDRLLIETKEVISGVFPGQNLYRIGGDEFVAICLKLDEETFFEKLRLLREGLTEGTVCKAAVGGRWCEKTTAAQEFLRQAEKEMYREKAEYYKRTGKK